MKKFIAGGVAAVLAVLVVDVALFVGAVLFVVWAVDRWLV